MRESDHFDGNEFVSYRKIPTFSDTYLLYCKHSKIQIKRFYYGVIPPNDANGIANSEDPDQTVPRACPRISVRKCRIFTFCRESANQSMNLGRLHGLALHPRQRSF